MSDTFLTKTEVAELTGRKTKSKQIEHLRRIAVPFWVNALGVPVVPRWVVEGKRDKADLLPPRDKVTSLALSGGSDDWTKAGRAIVPAGNRRAAK